MSSFFTRFAMFGNDRNQAPKGDVPETNFFQDSYPSTSISKRLLVVKSVSIIETISRVSYYVIIYIYVFSINIFYVIKL